MGIKVKRFADRLPNEVIKHIEEAGEIKIINILETNNRTVVYYVEAEEGAALAKKSVKKQQPTDKGLKDG